MDGPSLTFARSKNIPDSGSTDAEEPNKLSLGITNCSAKILKKEIIFVDSFENKYSFFCFPNVPGIAKDVVVIVQTGSFFYQHSPILTC